MISSVNQLFKDAAVHQGKMLHFHAGDIIKGKVTKLFPNQTALVQFGGGSLVAQLQAPLTAGTPYWFEIQGKTDGKWQLKVLTELHNMMERNGEMNSLLKEMQLPATPKNEQLLSSLLAKSLPLPKHHLASISQWLSSGTIEEADVLALEQMMERKFPFTKETFLSVRSLHDGSSFTNQLQALLASLEGETSAAPEKAPLKEMVTNVLSYGALADSGKGQWDGKELANGLKLILQSLGLDHEHKAGQMGKSDPSSITRESLHTLKAMLLHVQSYSEGAERDLIDQLIYKITGQQLSVREDGPVTSLYMQLPIGLGNDRKDVMIQWEGRRKANGEIDPNYCRIVFCLQLEHLKETVVNVSVQNRVVTIGVINEHAQLPALIKQFEQALKEKLTSLHYHLSEVKVMESDRNLLKSPASLKQAARYDQGSPYLGVDIKI
jgi:hypothetical protein